MAIKRCTKLEVCWERCPIVFQGHLSNFKVTRLKQIVDFYTKGVSGLKLQFEFTNGYLIMHKAWSSIEEVPYCFSRSSIKCQGHTGQKITDFDLNWTFPDCNPSLNSPMALKWRTMLDVVWTSSPIVYQGHPSNFEVTRPKKSPILTRIERFRTVTPIWILWNDAQRET